MEDESENQESKYDIFVPFDTSIFSMINCEDAKKNLDEYICRMCDETNNSISIRKIVVDIIKEIIHIRGYWDERDDMPMV